MGELMFPRDIARAIVALLSGLKPAHVAMAIAAVVNEIAKSSNGAEIVRLLTQSADALGWRFERAKPLPLSGPDETLMMERLARDERGALTERAERVPYRLDFLSALAFDIDGPIRRCTVPGQPCPNKDGEWVLAPGAAEFFQWQRQHLPKLKIGYASNQAGVGLGYLSKATALQMVHEAMNAACGHTNFAGAVCTSPDKAHPDRKPNPGMLNHLSALWEIHPHFCLYVGDMETDRQAALAAGWWYIDHQDLIGRFS